MNYDQWKTMVPEEEPDFKCNHCDIPIEEVGYCSRDCFEADQI